MALQVIGNGGGTGGANNPNSSSNATANTGGGSGGANDVASGNGGSGVVILRLAIRFIYRNYNRKSDCYYRWFRYNFKIYRKWNL